MRRIDRKSWPRHEHYDVYRQFDHPHFSICANVDLSTFHPYVKDRGISFTVAIVYVLARAANEIPEFRLRIRADEVIEHEVVRPSITIIKDDELFTFCTIDYCDDYNEFTQSAVEQIAHVKENPILEDGPGQDDLLFMTTIPWVSFTSFSHPVRHDPTDSFPRIAWGKFFQEGEQLKMPLSVQVHHALMDGLHVGRYFGKVQQFLDNPEEFMK